MPDAKVLEDYVTSVVDHVGDGTLTSTEEVLGAKLKATQEQASDVREQSQQLQESIRQAQNRAQLLGQQHLELVSKAAGFMESLIALKFEAEFEKEEVAPKGNGSQGPSASKKKKRKRKLAQQSA